MTTLTTPRTWATPYYNERKVEWIGEPFSRDVTVPVDTAAEFALALEAMGECNAFDPQQIALEFAAIGGEFMSIHVGWAGSPLIELHPPYWNHQALSGGNGWPYGKLTARYRLDLCTIAACLAFACDADEISLSAPASSDTPWSWWRRTRWDHTANPFESGSGIYLRLWWD